MLPRAGTHSAILGDRFGGGCGSDVNTSCGLVKAKIVRGVASEAPTVQAGTHGCNYSPIGLRSDVKVSWSKDGHGSRCIVNTSHSLWTKIISEVTAKKETQALTEPSLVNGLPSMMGRVVSVA